VKELEATLNGHGSAWLVAGESGVGKSRLMDELRSHALVKGALVVRGEEKSEGGNPYQPWREIIRRLCLLNGLSSIEVSTLKPLVPDITRLLEREAADAPLLDAGAAQDRLFTTVEQVFRRYQRPLVVILEDLHWADTASLFLLLRVLRITAEAPLLIVGTYRDDERPALSGNLPGMSVLRLGRLGDEAIRQLAVSMLGPAGEQQRVVDLLHKESDGNAFFLVEVVRSLAEESGGLRNIGAAALPARVFAGKVQAIVKRRLDRLPEDAKHLLKLAAVSDRQLDLTVLRAAEPTIDLDQWLAICASVDVVEVEDANWRFSHNQVRQGLLDSLTPEELKLLNGQVAQAIESVYPDGVGRLAVLALHWEIAGNTARAAQWYRRAGQQAEDAYAPEAAIEYYQKALAFLPDTPEFVPHRVAIYTGLGKMLRWQARFDEATQTFISMRDAALSIGDQVAQARAWIGLADVQDRQGNRAEALANAEQAEQIARAAGISAQTELADALGTKGWSLYRLRRRDEAVVVAQETLELSTRLNLRNEMARSESLMGIVHAISGRYDQAIVHMLKALAIARELGDKRDVGIKLSNLGEVTRLQGDHSGALKFFAEALTIFQQIGYREAELAVLTNLGGAQVELHDFVTAETHLRRVIDLTGGADWWGLADTYASLAAAVLGQGVVDEALVFAVRALAEGKKAEVQEFMGKAWRVLGMIAAVSPEPITIDEQPHTATNCFEQSLQIFTHEGSESEQAYTLRAWARAELEEGDGDKGARMWQAALEIFQRLGMPKEVQRMALMP
jgi:tetratricopeptide (TPR) repeat protein